MTQHDSSKWTGHTDAELEAHYATHASGQSSVASDDRSKGWGRLAQFMPPELIPLKRLSFYVCLSPFALLIAWFALHGATGGYFAEDNRRYLVVWGGLAALYAIAEFRSRRKGLLALRKLLLWAVAAGTLVAAVAYVALGRRAYRTAEVSPPERTFEFARSCGRNCTEWIHQRGDGSALSGAVLKGPVNQARTCALGQRIQGAYGFVWIRILDRSRAPRRGQLAWPITKEECFSTMPLSSLPR